MVEGDKATENPGLERSTIKSADAALTLPALDVSALGVLVCVPPVALVTSTDNVQLLSLPKR